MNIRIVSPLSYGRNYIEKDVNYTMLTSCLYLNKKAFSQAPGKTAVFYEDKYSDYCLLKTISDQDRNLIANSTKGLKISIKVFPDKKCKKEHLIAHGDCSFNEADRQYTISFTKDIKLALQTLFPVSTSLAKACGSNLEIDTNSALYESIGISPYVEKKGNGGLNIFPIRKVDIKSIIKDFDLLFSLADAYTKENHHLP